MDKNIEPLFIDCGDQFSARLYIYVYKNQLVYLGNHSGTKGHPNL